jgi:hypothetical protein
MVVAETYLDTDWRTADDLTKPLLMRAHTTLVNTFMSTQAKVDETRLRRQQFDRLPELLRLVNETQARLPVVPSGPVVDLVAAD